jgi:DNA helicase-2/ATP-dependent DNA helicase PcrA
VSLNAEQLKAVHARSGPLLVLAGAGSGKTRVVTFRIRELIAHGTRPDRILAVTFTNKAAREMRSRASEIVKAPRGTPRPEISTLHSLCVRILRRHAERLGYPRQFSICDQGDQESMARAALRNVHVDQQKLKPGDFLSLVGGWKSHGLDARGALDAARDERQELAAMAYERYQAELAARGVMDFDDLLICTERLFDRFADVREAEAARFDHVMIDEYQDTNGSQYRIIKALCQKHRNLCVVGDDDQSIYGWRGAEVAHILNFTRDWPDALVVRLETNYRSRAPILALANTLIANNGKRHSKVLRPFREGGSAPRFIRFEDETAEATAIVREIEQATQREDEERVPLHHFAILFRTNEQPRAFELELRRQKLRYVLVGGQSFFDRKEVRDILAYLKVLANPGDEVSLLRIINTPSRGIGSSTIKALVDVAVRAGAPLWRVLPSAPAELELPPAMAERVADFTRLVERYRARLESEPISAVLRALLAEIDYRQELERVYKTAAEVEARSTSIDGVVRSAEEYEARADCPTLPGFLEETALGGRDDFADEREKSQNAVTLMTLHSAKGLEFPHVYMVGMEEGLLPHRRAIVEGNGVDEERRLCYVGVTRAEETLTLSMCKSRTKWGKARPSIPSRFLLEMRGENDKAAKAAEAAEALIAREAGADAGARPAGEAAAQPRKSGSATGANSPRREAARPKAAPTRPSATVPGAELRRSPALGAETAASAVARGSGHVRSPSSSVAPRAARAKARPSPAESRMRQESSGAIPARPLRSAPIAIAPSRAVASPAPAVGTPALARPAKNSSAASRGIPSATASDADGVQSGKPTGPGEPGPVGRDVTPKRPLPSPPASLTVQRQKF